MASVALLDQSWRSLFKSQVSGILLYCTMKECPQVFVFHHGGTQFPLVLSNRRGTRKALAPSMPWTPHALQLAAGGGSSKNRLTFQRTRRNIINHKPILFIIIDTWWYMSICIIFLFNCDNDVLVVWTTRLVKSAHMRRQVVDLVPNNGCSGALTLSVLRILVGTPQPTRPLVFSGATSWSNFSKSEGTHNGNHSE